MTDKITYIEFPSTDREASGAFFAQAFGWGRVSYGPNYEALTEAGIDGGIDGSAERVSAPMTIIQTDDLDGAEKRVIAAGGVITRAPGGSELAVFVERPI